MMVKGNSYLRVPVVRAKIIAPLPKLQSDNFMHRSEWLQAGLQMDTVKE
jgi:hypothetical protein